MMDEPTLFVGIDWATDEHVVVVLDAAGKAVAGFTVEHSGPAIGRLVERLLKLGNGMSSSDIAVAIETPRGAVVETLVERGFQVFHLNPKQLDRFRDRFFPSGVKDDSKDAMVLASALRTDRRCYREVALDGPLVLELREHVRMHEDLQQEATRLANRLGDQLVRYFPDLLRVAKSADEPWLLELLERATTPASAARMHRGTVAKILRKHRIRRLGADDVVAALRGEPLELAPGSVEAAAAHVRLLIPRIRMVQQQDRQVCRRLDELLKALSTVDEDADENEVEHRDAEIILSMPGAGIIVTATMLAEANQPLQDRDYTALRAHAGVAPITQQTGKRKHGKGATRRPKVRMRRACNARLRNALYHSARVASQFDPPSQRYYAALRARGHTHGRALRSVADRWLRILFAMLRDSTLYDPTRFEPAPAEQVA